MAENGFSETELRQAQLDNYNRTLQAHRNDPNSPAPIVDDRSDGSKTYASLGRVWMPMILDVVGKTPWTVEEIVKAMRPVINKFAREISGKRAAYQSQEAISDGELAILKCLQKDAGRAPFGLYAAKEARRAILKGARGSALVRQRVRDGTFSDRNITSMDVAASTGTGDRTIAGNISSTTPIAGRVRCPDCGGSRNSTDPETGETIPCPTCQGEGYKTVWEPRTTPATTYDDVEGRERVSQFSSFAMRVLDAAELSPRQSEAILLRYGMEGAISEELRSTNEPKQSTAIAKILGVADAILLTRAEGQPLQNKTEIWKEAQKLGKVDEFQSIWDEVFGNMEHRPFNPSLPPSLQIAPLYGVFDEIIDAQGEPTGKTKSTDRLEGLLARLSQAIAPDAYFSGKGKSKTLVNNMLEKAFERLNRVSQIPEFRQLAQALMNEGEIDTEEELDEWVNNILKYNYALLLEEIAEGKADAADLQLGYIIYGQ